MLAAGAVFIAVAWLQLALVVRGLILIVITAGFGLSAQLALRRGLQATAEAMAVIASGMFVLDVAAARRAGLPGLADLATAPYEILAGVLLVAAAGGAAFMVRTQRHWLWTLDGAVAFGMARAAVGTLRLSSDDYALSSVTLVVVTSLLYVAFVRIRFPIARWSVLGVGCGAWMIAVAVGAEHATNHVGGDVGRVADSWPALTAALVAGLWSILLSPPAPRRIASWMCLSPVLLVFEIVGWSHGWVVGCFVMLVGYVVAALTSDRVGGTWTSAVAGSALVLGLSAVFGLLPTALELAARMGLALQGTWRAPRGLPFDLAPGDVGPWLLPLTALVVLALLPQIRIDGERVTLDQRLTAGVFLATLGVLPMLYGAGFWLSMLVLVIVAAVLLGAARLWRNDYLLLLAWAPLVIIRICSYYIDPVHGDLADPLAWTLFAAVCLAWALSERRRMVRSGFLVAAGLFALAGVAQWLDFAQAPRSIHGFVIVAIGSLGMVASQRLVPTAINVETFNGRRTKGWLLPLLEGSLHGAASHPSTRAVGEGLSVTWVLVGLAMAGSSASHRALELTVAGVAAGITAYLSEDRRRAGWVSGVLLTMASWIRLADNNVEAVEVVHTPGRRSAAGLWGSSTTPRLSRVVLALPRTGNGTRPGPVPVSGHG